MNVTDPKPRKTVAAIIVAGGRGSRAASGNDTSPKQYRLIGGEPVIARTLKVFQNHPLIDQIVTVIHADDGDMFQTATSGLSDADTTTGGPTRQQSVFNGLKHLDENCLRPDIVLIHDAARPFLDHATIDRVIGAMTKTAGAIAAMPAVDTLKSTAANGTISATIPRAGIWAAQTPQGFWFDTIYEAHKKAANEQNLDFTDDAAVAEWFGIDVAVVEGIGANVKLTTLEDLAAADGRLTREHYLSLADVRVGNGYDVHAFTQGSSVRLGGVDIAHSHALRGHSDADVAMHAITDALFGALGDGDIGSHFPPSELKWKGASSDIFLQKAVAGVTDRGGMICHIDLTIICEVPKIGPHRDVIRTRLAELCEIPADRVSVKATTTEKLGFTGRREGIAAMATATIRLPLPGKDNAG